MSLRYLSLCSGIEAASVAWHPLDWRPAAFAEIEAFPSEVLAHHYPNVPNFGDMTKFKEWTDAAIDVLVGGTPCQSFSIAGDWAAGLRSGGAAMTRGTSRMVVKTRSGFSEIRVERRAMPRAEVRAPALPVIVMPVDPSLADRIAAQLRGRIAFPAEFYRGAAE